MSPLNIFFMLQLPLVAHCLRLQKEIPETERMLPDLEISLDEMKILQFAWQATPIKSGNFTCDLPETKYLMVTDCWEQFGGSRRVIADALVLAKKLGAVFVEPVYSKGRVSNPFNRDPNEYVPLRHILDTDAMKKFYPNWIHVEDFLSSCEARGHGTPKLHIENGKPNGTNLEINAVSMDKLKKVKEQIVVMQSFKRGGPQFLPDEWTSPDGVSLDLSKEIEKKANDIRRGWKKWFWQLEQDYICVQWRQEQVEGSPDKMDCAHSLLETVLPLAKGKKVLLLSDIREGTSDTGGQSKDLAKLFEKKLNYEELLQPVLSIEHSSIQALVELHLCAASPVMVACPSGTGGMCEKCSRTQSKFASLVMSKRAELKLPKPVTWR